MSLLLRKTNRSNYRNHFSKRNNTTKCDVIFVFGGSHPGNWQAPLEAYRQSLGNQIIVTGGTSLHGMKHPSWNYGDLSEAEVIVNKLMEHGVPKDAIMFETNSLHSIANVMEAKRFLISQRLIGYYLYAKA